ncbi:phosphoglucosamine mutase [Coriobacteriia bacterium Es71-Z0120]|uniref:phosphoglucosamine mutase n=1 Tax=Parvivirga hydrogeniphila TaxID=2939460 RepID=UPI002260CB53|nr:phosphoglucosamine mutase [Parvivirga hydrogeniphila]MCL4078571.1 phosphoglucosamine mutase [Parvivirga hydrogeniphila]
MGRLFGTDGVRGVANAELTPELAFKIGEAASRFLAKKGSGTIVVGTDTRRSADMLEAAVVAGICAGGADALRLGVVPTPAVAYLARSMEADGGVVISASHNPAEYNGIKLFDRDGFKLPDEIEDEIEEFLVAERPAADRPVGARVGRAYAVPDAQARYVSHAIDTIGGDLVGLTIAVDCGHGAASFTTVKALRDLGAIVHAVNCDSTGLDINAGCGSTHMDVISDLVRAHEVDFGIAHDGDADRVLAVDGSGAVVDGDQIMAIAAVHMKQQGRLAGDLLVATVMSNLGLEVAMREHGIAVLKTKVGDRYVIDQMRASGAVLGGEQSGHIIFMEHTTTGDGLITALQLASIVKSTDTPLSELRTVMRRYPQVLLNVPVADKALLASSTAVHDAVHDAERRLGEHGRVLVRPSGTEPLVRVMVEAAEEQVAREIAASIAEVVRTELG